MSETALEVVLMDLNNKEQGTPVTLRQELVVRWSCPNCWQANYTHSRVGALYLMMFKIWNIETQIHTFWFTAYCDRCGKRALYRNPERTGTFYDPYQRKALHYRTPRTACEDDEAIMAQVTEELQKQGLEIESLRLCEFRDRKVLVAGLQPVRESVLEAEAMQGEWVKLESIRSYGVHVSWECPKCGVPNGRMLGCSQLLEVDPPTLFERQDTFRDSCWKCGALVVVTEEEASMGYYAWCRAVW